MADQPAEDLRPWGYAPGDYVIPCKDCGDLPFKDRPLADKRAWRCETHARQARESDVSERQTTVVLDLSGDELTMLRDVVIRVACLTARGRLESPEVRLRRIDRLCDAAIKASPAMSGFLGYGGPEAHRDIISGSGKL